jgi:hypothetical protein
MMMVVIKQAETTDRKLLTAFTVLVFVASIRKCSTSQVSLSWRFSKERLRHFHMSIGIESQPSKEKSYSLYQSPAFVAKTKAKALVESFRFDC